MDRSIDLMHVALKPNAVTWVPLRWDQRSIPLPWVRVEVSRAAKNTIVLFTSGAARQDSQPESAALFNSLAPATQNGLAATVRARGENKGTLHYMPADGSALYELNADLKLQRVEDGESLTYHKDNCAIASGMLTTDAASVIYTDDSGKRWRLPKGDLAFDQVTTAGPARICREVCTERDLFNAHGTFYELPAENAGGFAKVRPICTHNRRIHDYCSWRGLLIMTGLVPDAAAGEHIIRSDDGQAAIWAGAVDDLWKLPTPTGTGGPWRNTPIKANQPSDPCLLWGFAERQLTLSHASATPVTFKVEFDLTGDGQWVHWKNVTVPTSATTEETLPPEVQARWLRVTSAQDTTATARLFFL
jgi:hypothetical protein